MKMRVPIPATTVASYVQAFLPIIGGKWWIVSLQYATGFELNSTSAGLHCSQREYTATTFKWHANQHTVPKIITTGLPRGETAIRLWDISDVVLWNFVY